MIRRLVRVAERSHFLLVSADVRIFDNYRCMRSYGSVFDPNTEICAGDYNQKTDTMVNTLPLILLQNSLSLLEW